MTSPVTAADGEDVWTAQTDGLRERLSLAPTARIVFASSLAFVTGSALGISHGAQMAALRFRAENSHRLPTSQRGWYLYHKTKNYYVMRDALREGMKMGTKLSFWVGAFFLVEEAVDQLRWLHKDFLSTTVAGLSIAGAFSWWSQLPMVTTARMTRIGLVAGLGYGFAQDAVQLLHGQRLGYIDFLLGRGRRNRKVAPPTNTTVD